MTPHNPEEPDNGTLNTINTHLEERLLGFFFRLFGAVILLILLGLLVYLAFMMILPISVITEYQLPLEKLSMQETIRLACAIVFVVCLSMWVLDSINWIKLQPGVSKSIWGIAISATLSTSVLFFSSSYSTRMPLEGPWRATTHYDNSVENHKTYLTYDSDADTYVGYGIGSGTNWYEVKIMGSESVKAEFNIGTVSHDFQSIQYHHTEYNITKENKGNLLVFRDEEGRIFTEMER